MKRNGNKIREGGGGSELFVFHYTRPVLDLGILNNGNKVEFTTAN